MTNNETTKLNCCVCQQPYEIRTNTPMWASCWEFCPACVLEDDDEID